VLHKGRIVEAGPTAAIIHTPEHPYTARLLAARFDLGSDRTRPLPVDTSTPARPWSEAWPATHEENIVLALAGVSKSFNTGSRTLWGTRRPKPVLRSVELSIRAGECVALVGESGAGKSTLLRIAAGLVAPDSGTVARAGSSLPQIVFQDAGSSLTPWLTIGEQIGERLRGTGASAHERKTRLGEAMRLVGLDPALAGALPRELSGGQAQRAVIARAIVVPPALLLCDEPISSLDVTLAAATLNLLGELRRRLGMAMLFVTHDLAAARLVADRIAVLDGGELVEDADPDTLIAAPKAAYTRQLIAAVPRLDPVPLQ
jgi:peptide/nickel transport system ATP-binding protein